MTAGWWDLTTVVARVVDLAACLDCWLAALKVERMVVRMVVRMDFVMGQKKALNMAGATVVK